MLSRTLSLATVTLLIAGFLAVPAPAQNQNLEAGKTPSQIFAGTCTACHKGPRGLLRAVAPSSLQGFLRQHYTTSPEMASLLASFLVSNGAADRIADQPKSGRAEKPEIKPGGVPDQPNRFGRRLRTAPPQDAAKLESESRDGSKAGPDTAEPGRQGRGGRRSVRPEEPAAAEGQTPAQLSNERGTAKQKLGKRSKPGVEEAPKTEDAKTDTAKEEPAKTEASQGDTPKNETANEAAKSEGGKSEGKAESDQAEGTKVEAAKPSVDPRKLESAGVETPSETDKLQTPASGPDPIGSVTPTPPTGSAAVKSATTEPPAAPAVAQPTQSTQPSQAMAISAPPAVAPAGPPVPPISR
jgi:hypothetical protein